MLDGESHGLGLIRDQTHPCAFCGWTGPRRVREVAWCSIHKQWVCEHCFVFKAKC